MLPAYSFSNRDHILTIEYVDIVLLVQDFQVDAQNGSLGLLAYLAIYELGPIHSSWIPSLFHLIYILSLLSAFAQSLYLLITISNVNPL